MKPEQRDSIFQRARQRSSRGLRVAACCVAGTLAVATLMSPAARAAGDDPYAPLQLYDGTWEVAAQSNLEKVQRFTNHCVRTGVFFECEQVVEGKTSALMVFMPTTRLASGAQVYRIEVLRPDGARPGDWNALTIDGSRWVYTWEAKDEGHTSRWRNTNVFSGTDKIHFEIETSADGKNWKSVKVGDETRVVDTPH